MPTSLKMTASCAWSYAIVLGLFIGLGAAHADAIATHDPTQIGWNTWRQARDAELANVLTSYLSVLNHTTLKVGQLTYLPLGGPRSQAGWRKEAPGKPMVTVTAKGDAVDALVSSSGETTDLLDAHEGWTTPDGMVVTAQKTGVDYQLVLRDPQKAGFKGFKGLPYFDFNPQAIVKARFSTLTQPMKTSVMTTLEGNRQVWLMGTLDFTVDGKKTQLKAYCLGAEPSSKALFVPFLDATNGIESYSGGRYVEASINASGAVVLDFNRAYNPLCARNPAFSCIKVSGKPIEARVLAGEQAPPHH